MSAKFNPFHSWLGLKPTLTNPNHYQLLGISSSVTDNNLILQAAKARLALLKQVDAGDKSELLEKLKARVAKAHKILSTAELRKQYDGKLRAALEARRAAGSGKGSHSSVQLPPTASATDLVPPAPKTVDTDVPTLPPTVAETEATEPIPMAVPIAQQDQATSPMPQSAPVFDVGGGDAGEGSKSALDIKSEARLKRRKKSLLVPVAMGLLMLAGASGVLWSAMNYEKLVAAFNRGNPAVEPKTISEEEKKKQAIAKAAEDRKAEDRKEEDRKEEDKKIDVSELKHSLADEKKEVEAKKENPKPKKEMVKNVSNVPTKKLDFSSEVQLRRHLTNARAGLLNRDKQLVKNELQNAESLFLQFEDNPDLRLDPEQDYLRDQIDATMQVADLIDGFWKQVVTSSMGISGGQEIRVEDDTLGFVEGTDQFVVLRRAGGNVNYSYDILPARVAHVLGDQGEKEDLPSWRMQQAAFILLHKPLYDDAENEAMKLANLAAEDGHVIEPLSEFSGFDLASFGVPDAKIKMPSDKELRNRLPKKVRGMGLPDISKIRPEQASGIVDTVIDRTAMNDIDEKQIPILFEIAFITSMQTQDIVQVKRVLDEMGLWLDFDPKPRYVAAMRQIASKPNDLSKAKAQRLAKEMVAFLRENEDGNYKRLKGITAKLCKEFGFNEIAKSIPL